MMVRIKPIYFTKMQSECSLIIILYVVLQINFAEADYLSTEGSTLTNPIRLQFRNTQNPFTLILSPVSIEEAEDIFKVEQFIDTSGGPGSQATSGKSLI